METAPDSQETEAQPAPESYAAGTGPGPKGLVGRVKDILLKPNEEWKVIAAEATTPKQLYLGYVMILALITPIATLIGLWAIGFPVGNGFISLHVHMPFGRTLGLAIVMYILTLAGVYLLALVINELAPSFDGEKNLTQALKLSAYSYTPAWLIGIVMLWYPIHWLKFLGLYGLYLLFLGIPTLMKSPKEKALGYTVVAIVAMIVIYILIGLFSSLVLGTTRLAF